MFYILTQRITMGVCLVHIQKVESSNLSAANLLKEKFFLKGNIGNINSSI